MEKGLSTHDVVHDKSIINRIMLGYRPIAPKPAAGDPAWMQANKSYLVAKGRTKRKYVRVKKNSGCKQKKKPTTQEDDDDKRDHAVTLQLLPESERSDHVNEYHQEKIDLKLTTSTTTTTKTRVNVEENQSGAMWFYDKLAQGNFGVMVVESLVSVESVTDMACMVIYRGLGESDHERLRNLEMDTCPGFISDSCNRVQWVNEAYKSMIMSDLGDGKPLELRVELAMKENFLSFVSTASVFTCQVKLQYTWHDGKCSQMVPCDVWRMDFGGFAWRLDVKAALRLGR